MKQLLGLHLHLLLVLGLLELPLIPAILLIGIRYRACECFECLDLACLQDAIPDWPLYWQSHLLNSLCDFVCYE